MKDTTPMISLCSVGCPYEVENLEGDIVEIIPLQINFLWHKGSSSSLYDPGQDSYAEFHSVSRIDDGEVTSVIEEFADNWIMSKEGQFLANEVINDKAAYAMEYLAESRRNEVGW